MDILSISIIFYLHQIQDDYVMGYNQRLRHGVTRKQKLP
jgi:hypothetical protein